MPLSITNTGIGAARVTERERCSGVGATELLNLLPKYPILGKEVSTPRHQGMYLMGQAAREKRGYINWASGARRIT